LNNGEPWPTADEAWFRVRRMQTKLHQWAVSDAGRRFDDLFNLVCHPDFLTAAWERVAGNKGGRTPGVDRVAPWFISEPVKVEAFLGETRELLRSREFVPLPVRERMIPKSGQPGKFRRLGIPTARDRLVQAALVLVLEPIFEADFKPVSYGFRPRRRAQDAIAEIHFYGTGSRSYEWVFEADIAACFDELAHSAVLDRLRRRVRGQVGSFPGEVIPESGCYVRGGAVSGNGRGHPTRWHRVATAREHRTVDVGRALHG